MLLPSDSYQRCPLMIQCKGYKFIVFNANLNPFNAALNVNACIICNGPESAYKVTIGTHYLEILTSGKE